MNHLYIQLQDGLDIYEQKIRKELIIDIGVTMK